MNTIFKEAFEKTAARVKNVKKAMGFTQKAITKGKDYLQRGGAHIGRNPGKYLGAATATGYVASDLNKRPVQNINVKH